MQKVIFYLSVILSVCMLASCSKDDDDAISLKEKEVTLLVDGKQQLKATGEVSKWSSANDFITSVSENGMITANHVGETIMVQKAQHYAEIATSCATFFNFYL